ncbi:MAG TPA: hypothetical protein VGM30_05750 [Puia sp.]
MKRILLLTLLLVPAVSLLYSQNDLKARNEYEEAEKVFTESNYSAALEKIATVEGLLGKWVPKVSYLKIRSLQRLADQDESSQLYLPKLKDEVARYMKYAADNKDNVTQESFDEVYMIEKELNDPELRRARIKKQNEEWFSKGMTYYNTKDYTGALPWFMKAAVEGNADYAMSMLGTMSELGFGLPLSASKAIEWYTKAVGKGGIVKNIDIVAVQGIYRLGGNDVPKNYAKCMEWNEKITDDPTIGAGSMGTIGDLYAEGGYGIEQDYAKAVEWWSKAVEKAKSSYDKYTIMEKIADLYREGGHGLQKDKKLAGEWESKAKLEKSRF